MAGGPVVPARAGHYPGAVSPVKRMIPGKALLVSIPILAAGGIVMGSAHARVADLRSELAVSDAQGRAEGESYLKTLQGAHAQRQLELLTHHHDVALQLATARRDRLLGFLLVLAGALAFQVVRVAQRVAGEIEDAGRLPGRPPDGGGDGSHEAAVTRTHG